MSQLPTSMSLVKAISLIVTIGASLPDRKADADAVDDATPDLLTAEKARLIYQAMQVSLEKIQHEKKLTSPTPAKPLQPW